MLNIILLFFLGGDLCDNCVLEVNKDCICPQSTPMFTGY